MDNGIWLKKGHIYKLRTSTEKAFKRDYMIFSPSADFYFSGTWHRMTNTFFTINLNGEIKLNASAGIWPRDKLEELTVTDWLEVGQHLRCSSLRINLKTKELVEIKVKEEELVEL